MAPTTAAVCLLACVFALAAHAQVINPKVTATATNGALKFAVLGNWGRAGYCSPVSSYNADYCIGAFEQVGTANWLNNVCGVAGPCSFIVSPGHSFYPSGASSTDTINRFVTDWQNVYNLAGTPNINNATWYTALGDHDQDGNVTLYIAQNSKTPQWIFPSRYYLQDITAGSISVRLIVLDDQPWLSGNVQQPGSNKNSSNFNAEFRSQQTPDAVNAQLTFLESALNSSTANYTFVVQHQPIFGTAPGYAYSDAQTNSSSPFVRELALLKKYNPTAVLTADDKVMSYTRQTNETFTHHFNSGAGSEPDCGDALLAASVPWVKYVNSNCATGQSNNGFLIVTLTPTNATVDIYTTTYTSNSAEAPDTYFIPYYTPNYTVIIPPGPVTIAAATSAGRKLF